MLRVAMAFSGTDLFLYLPVVVLFVAVHLSYLKTFYMLAIEVIQFFSMINSLPLERNL